jgi:hypothetical protein
MKLLNRVHTIIIQNVSLLLKVYNQIHLHYSKASKIYNQRHHQEISELMLQCLVKKIL